MITVNKFIKRLKYAARRRVTHYNNQFPMNCGFLYPDQSISFDCINLIKSILNDPSCVYKKTPAGWYVKPGQVVPDGYAEIDLLTSGSEVKWYFKGIDRGEYLYMSGHGAIFVNDYTGLCGYTVNTIECTTDWDADGVCESYTDPYSGRRFDHKGGVEMRSWEAHSKMTSFVKYSKKSKFSDVSIDDKYYHVYEAVSEAGIMRADKKGRFKPNKHVTRKQLAIVVYRLLKMMENN